ncbi:UNVERIFIED_CONTAM: hypothetical protein Slati_2168400 [Sesamum latifolium]|uniref:Copia protein n=1 Tax=Sesamum latifolium TaxID=2727402 RepID=A0AAW2WRW4_9LAMI
MALSICEAEYVAATMATQECLWIRRLIRENANHPIQIFCDNESAIKLAENPVFHARSKHIETNYHLFERVLSQDIELQKIRTEKQVADIFTKALARAKFEEFRKALGVINNKLALREAVKN